jgi:hypothetical protein
MKGTTSKRIRRKSAYSLLDEQLKRGTKPEKINGKTTAKMIPLSEADKKRISTEMEKLSKKSF